MTRADLEKLTIFQIETLLCAGQFPTDGRELYALLARDRRAGVRRLAVKERQRLRSREVEAARLNRLRDHERRLRDGGAIHIAGVDEVGRGCLAGPVVAAAVILPADAEIADLDDSKELDPAVRERVSEAIMGSAVSVAFGVVSADVIDKVNVLEATMRAMRHALNELGIPTPDHVLVDGNRKPQSPFPETALVDGDARSMSIAAASIVAKVHRDGLMSKYDTAYPEYGFASNKGYGSGQHLEALRLHGPCPIHRHSFKPLAPDPDARSLHLFEEGEPGVDIGRRGEEAAALYLEGRGYRIRERRYRAAGAEIDLIAVAADGCLVFVEVKTSAVMIGSGPEDRVRPDKKKHLARAARQYLDRKAGGNRECRFDVVAVIMPRGTTSPSEVTHYQNAFQL